METTKSKPSQSPAWVPDRHPWALKWDTRAAYPSAIRRLSREGSSRGVGKHPPILPNLIGSPQGSRSFFLSFRSTSPPWTHPPLTTELAGGLWWTQTAPPGSSAGSDTPGASAALAVLPMTTQTIVCLGSYFIIKPHSEFIGNLQKRLYFGSLIHAQ